MNKEILVRCLKNAHRIILIGAFDILFLTFKGLSDVCYKCGNWLEDNLPIFGDKK